MQKFFSNTQIALDKGSVIRIEVRIENLKSWF